MNNQITLSGQDNIEVDEIDLALGGKFYIGGEIINGRVLASNSNGELYYADNDYISSSIFNENHTQEIDCEINRINITGDVNINKDNPIQVSGEKPINTFLGINNINEFGYYPINFTPTKIQFLNSGDEIESKVECFGDKSIVCDGWVKLHTITPFYLDQSPLGIENQVLGIEGGVMKWIFIKNPNIPVDANLEINSLIVDGFIPNDAINGVHIKQGLKVDGFTEVVLFKATSAALFDTDVRVLGTITTLHLVVNQDAIIYNLSVPHLATITTLIVNGVATFNGAVIFNTSVVINGSITIRGDTTFEGLTTFNKLATFNAGIYITDFITGDTAYGLWCVKGIKADGASTFNNGITCSGGAAYSLYVGGDAFINGDLLVHKSVKIQQDLELQLTGSNIIIENDSGSVGQVIGKDASNNLKWIDQTSGGGGTPLPTGTYSQTLMMSSIEEGVPSVPKFYNISKAIDWDRSVFPFLIDLGNSPSLYNVENIILLNTIGLTGDGSAGQEAGTIILLPAQYPSDFLGIYRDFYFNFKCFKLAPKTDFQNQNTDWVAIKGAMNANWGYDVYEGTINVKCITNLFTTGPNEIIINVDRVELCYEIAVSNNGLNFASLPCDDFKMDVYYTGAKINNHNVLKFSLDIRASVGYLELATAYAKGGSKTALKYLNV